LNLLIQQHEEKIRRWMERRDQAQREIERHQDALPSCSLGRPGALKGPERNRIRRLKLNTSGCRSEGKRHAERKIGKREERKGKWKGKREW
jgi:hypothetical protein